MSTPSDLARFVIDLMQAYRGISGRLMTSKTVKAMLQPEVDLDPRAFGTALSQGLGVFVKGSGSDLAFLHPGNNYPGSVCWLVGFPEQGKGAVLTGNSAQVDRRAISS